MRLLGAIKSSGLVADRNQLSRRTGRMRRQAPSTEFLDWVLRRRYAVIGATVALFITALIGMQFVQQQFFPNSDRPELLVDLTLPQGSSINATRKAVDDLESILKTDPDIEHWSFYVGSGAIRFYLPLDQQLANDFFAQAVVVTKGFKVRPAVQKRDRAALHRPEFEQVMSRDKPPRARSSGRLAAQVPCQRSGTAKVRDYAQSFASLLGKHRPRRTSISTGMSRPRWSASRWTRTAPARSASVRKL